MIKPNRSYKGEFKDHKRKIKMNFNINVLAFEEDDLHVVYCPALDVYGYGETSKEADKSFQVALKAFLEYTTAKNTFKSELKRLGWSVKENAKKQNIKMPEASKMLEKNDVYRDIINNKAFQQRQVQLAV